MKLIRALLALTLGLLGAFASAQNYVVAELRNTTTPQAIASQYSITLVDATPDGLYANYQASSSSQANSVVAAMASNSNVVRAEVSDSLANPNPKKGGTIPIVGDRTTLEVANQAMLDLINWRPELANSSGREVRVAILDTGLAYSAGGNLWSKVSAYRNFVEPGYLPLDRPLSTDSDSDGIVDEGVGHGTMVAGIIDLVAPKTKLIIARVADSDGVSTTWTVVEGIHFAIESGAEVINISLASTEKSQLVARAIRYAELHGAVVTSGLGNASAPEAYYPAKYSTVVSVAALQPDATKTSFSNWSLSCDAAAPGFSVVSQDATGTLAQWSGTSFATAFVSATIADCLRHRSRIAPAFTRFAVKLSGRSIDSANPDYRSKLGRLIDHAALDALLTLN